MHAIAYYRIETQGRCQAGLDAPTQHSGFRLGATTIAAGRSAQICSAQDLRVSTDGGNACAVASLSRMTPTEVASLPRRIRP